MRLSDDRGKTFVYKSGDEHAREPVDAAQRAGLSRLARTTLSPRVWPLYAFGAVGNAIFIIGWLVFPRKGSWALIGLGGLMILISAVRIIRLYTKLFIEQSVELGHCGCCNYRLEALPVEADGCTVCPECGHAWRLSAAAVTP